jgi:hypothetical protein
MNQVRFRAGGAVSNARLLCLTSTCCVIALTLAAWWLTRSPPPALLPDYDALVRFDPDAPGGHLRPNIDALVQGERVGQAVRWRTDGRGFRVDHAVSDVPTPGVERWLLLGDSLIDGMRTDQSQTVGALLQQQLGAGFEVVISGHNNPANAWAWLQDHGAAVQPHGVIVAITIGNDFFAQNLYAGLAPDVVPGRVRWVDRSMMDGDLRRLPEHLPARAYRAPSPWRDRWDAQAMAWRGWWAERSGWFADAVPPIAGSSRPRAVWDRDIYASIGLFYTPPMAYTTFSLDAVDLTLIGIATLLRERQVRFIIVLLPVRHQVRARDWQLLTRAYALNPDAFDLDAPNRRVLQTCAAQQIRCIDPTAAMRAHDRAGGASLFRPRGDMHYNEAGNALVAQVIAKAWRDPAP